MEVNGDRIQNTFEWGTRESCGFSCFYIYIKESNDRDFISFPKRVSSLPSFLLFFLPSFLFSLLFNATSEFN